LAVTPSFLPSPTKILEVAGISGGSGDTAGDELVQSSNNAAATATGS
jgi:hypothetical protein